MEGNKTMMLCLLSVLTPRGFVMVVSELRLWKRSAVWFLRFLRDAKDPARLHLQLDVKTSHEDTAETSRRCCGTENVLPPFLRSPEAVVMLDVERRQHRVKLTL